MVTKRLAWRCMCGLLVVLALTAPTAVDAPPHIPLAVPEPALKQGNETSQARTLVAEVTAYTYGDGNGDGLTATGTRPRPGICAVDPKTVPLGSILYIPGYGYARAEDTGGLIKGNCVDVFIPTREKALKWGRQVIEVKILGKDGIGNGSRKDG